MSVENERGLKAFTAGEALAAYRLVRQSAAGTVMYCDSRLRDLPEARALAGERLDLSASGRPRRRLGRPPGRGDNTVPVPRHSVLIRYRPSDPVRAGGVTGGSSLKNARPVEIEPAPCPRRGDLQEVRPATPPPPA
jgi:hypothetical protein